MPRKGSKPEKGPNRSHIEFSCFPGGDTQKSWHRPNFKRNRFKFLHLELPELSVPKLPHLPNPYFRREIGNSDDGSPQISSRQQSLPNFKSDQHQVSLLQGSILLVPKMGQCPKTHYATSISRILLGAFVPVGDPTKSWKFGPNWPGQSDVRACRNLGPKISTGLKKRIRA